MQHLLVYLKHKILCSILASWGLSTPQSTQTLFSRITSALGFAVPSSGNAYPAILVSVWWVRG